MKNPMQATRGPRWIMALLALGLLCALPAALAVDGVIEINDARAGIGGVTTGDTPGYPVTISEPGSYRLTGNLTQPDPAAHVITIASADVTLDLNGFTIQGPATCSGAPGAIICAPTGSGVGVFSSAANVTVHDGSLKGLAGGGLALGDHARVHNVRVEAGGGSGIVVGEHALVEDSHVSGLAGDGIMTGWRGGVFRCSVTRNNADGLVLGDGTGFGDNVINGNAGSYITSGTSLADNICDGVVCSCVGAEVCDYVDNDCDGEVDEGASWSTLGQVCSAGAGQCEGFGVFACDELDPAGPVVCSATAGSASSEVCDYFDNNCDGSVDEGATWSNLGQLCTVGVGLCVATGVYVCNGGNPAGPSICSAVPGVGGTEVCDELDNNCNGEADEGWQTGGVYGSDQACGNCVTDCTVIYNRPNAFGECDTSGAPVCIMSCDAGYLDLNGIPDDGCEFQETTDAIFVSQDGGSVDSPTCGTVVEPCLTITYGQSRAVTDGKSEVRVAAGAYYEDVTLVSGIDCLGGYNPTTWGRDWDVNATTIWGAGGSGDIKTVSASGITVATMFEGFVVYGAGATTVGADSYAIWIGESNSALTVRNNRVFGGQGAPGAGGSSGGAGSAGLSGNDGQDYIETPFYILSQCQSDGTTPGNQGSFGDAGTNSCTGGTVTGGAGAGAQCPQNNDVQPSGTNGQSAAGGGASGSGGGGGHDRSSSNCGTFGTGGYSAVGLPASDGQDGSGGMGGNGCSSPQGTVTGNTWSGIAGGAAGDGTDGGGAGGGGAGGGADVSSNCTGADDTLGGSGGGGGAGGCGGGGGTGGSAAGGSFGIFVSFNSTSGNWPVVSSNTITRGFGGAGGTGGSGGGSGQGGTGGAGGSVGGAQWGFVLGNGGEGGEGGSGGFGGGGGGGCGGVSYGIYHHNLSGTPDYSTVNTFNGGGASGAGGSGGASAGNSGTAGSAGDSGNVN